MSGGGRTKLGAGLGALGIGAAVIIGESVLSRATDASVDSLLSGDGSELLVNVEYPKIDEYCGPADLGLPPSASPPAALDFEYHVDLRQEIVRQGAQPIGNGEAILRLTMPPQDVAYVVDIRAVVFERGTLQPQWRYVGSIPCGGPVGKRTFFVNLDERNPRIVDLGSDIFSQEDPTIPQGSLGREFTVSEVDPIRINIIGMSCEASVSWGLEIEYIHEGVSKTTTVATPNEPFVIYGSDAPTFTPTIGPDKYGTGTLEPAPETPNSCRDLTKPPSF
jgi:hypothetical protein